MKEEITKLEQRILLFSVFILSLCGIVYELVLGSLATYLLGNPVQQYSITIGFFLSSMGLGSYLSRYLTKDILKTFVIIEILLGLIGGVSVIVLSYLFSFSPKYYLLHVFFLMVIGVMVGLEIPLLTRILKNYGRLKDILSNVLSLDYLGGLAGSLLFPLVLYPIIGRILTCILIGIMNIMVALIIVFKIKYKGKSKFDILFPLVSIILLLTLALNTKDINQIIEKRLYGEDVLYQKRTKYQEIVLTRNGAEFKLFLDGALQFSSTDEYRYHEMLIYPALSLNVIKDNIDVLMLGGGDGLAVRELLKDKRIKSITLVELDNEMINLAKNNSSLKHINGDSLSDSRVEVLINDAYVYLLNPPKKFDIIYADFPDPHDETIAKLYSTMFYKMVYNSLKDDGIFVTQSTSPYFAPEAFWCINNTLTEVFKSVIPYHVYIPSFGDWGFNLAYKRRIGNTFDNIKNISFKYFSEELFLSSKLFSRDRAKIKTELNTFNKPVVYKYYLKGWKNSTDY